MTTLNDGAILETSSETSGTGLYDSFLRLQALGQETTEEGFNNDVEPKPVLDEKKEFTNSIQLGSLALVEKDGIFYYAFSLDVAEANSADAPDLTLDDLRIYVSGTSATSLADLSSSGFSEVFDLTGSLGLEDVNPGNGKDDYIFYIPKSLFDAAGATADSYVTLYSSFSDVDSSFEEWSAKVNTAPPPTADITIDKVTVDGTYSGDGIDILSGEVISWQYTITNTGDVDLANVVVTDDNGTVATEDDFTYTIGSLAVGASVVVTQFGGTAQIGDYANTATVAGDYGSTSVSATDGSSYFGIDPSLTLEKVTVDDLVEGDDITVISGEAISWKYTVTNDGNVALTNIVVVDDNGTEDTFDDFTVGTIASLGIGESAHLTYSGVAITGAYSNTATATSAAVSDDAGHTAIASDEDSSNYFGIDPSLTLEKVTVDDLVEGDGITVISGEAISWKYTVTNDGNVALTNIVVRDDNGTADTSDDFDVGTIASLGIGESAYLTYSGVAITGAYSNTATATSAAVSDDAGHTATASDEDSSSYFGAWADLVLSKLTNDSDDAGVFLGDAIEWTYSLKLAEGSNVGLSNIKIVDDHGTSDTSDDFTLTTPASGDANSNGVLDLGETWVFDFDGIASQYSYTNTAEATGDFTDDAGHKLLADDSDTSSYHTEYTGLSKGFWQNSNGLQDWDLCKTDSFETFFGVNQVSWVVGQTSGKKPVPITQADVTLLEALNLTGGGVNQLASQAVAAALNASDEDLDYRYTLQEIKDMVQEAFGVGSDGNSSTNWTISSLQTELEFWNAHADNQGSFDGHAEAQAVNTLQSNMTCYLLA